EKAFPVKGESSYKGKSEDSRGRGRGRGGFHGRGHGGRSRGNASDSRQQKKVECWDKQKDEQKNVNFA
ncbi:hypothetical protein CICLE_v10030259mg, partial [Citrus x clementina]